MCGRKSDTSLVVSQAELLAGVRAARERLAGAGPDRSRRPGDFERVSLPSADGDVLRDLLGFLGFIHHCVTEDSHPYSVVFQNSFQRLMLPYCPGYFKRPFK